MNTLENQGIDVNANVNANVNAQSPADVQSPPSSGRERGVHKMERGSDVMEYEHELNGRRRWQRMYESPVPIHNVSMAQMHSPTREYEIPSVVTNYHQQQQQHLQHDERGMRIQRRGMLIRQMQHELKLLDQQQRLEEESITMNPGSMLATHALSCRSASHNRRLGNNDLSEEVHVDVKATAQPGRAPTFESHHAGVPEAVPPPYPNRGTCRIECIAIRANS